MESSEATVSQQAVSSGASGNKPPRDQSIDALKGLGILGVIVLHCFGRASRKVTGADWWFLQEVSLMLNFCVPVFLALSALMYARSESKKNEGWRGVPRRFFSLAYPFYVWTGVYLASAIFINHSKVDWYRTLVWGKAQFHLYFMVILLQVALTFPIWVWIARRFNSFWLVTGFSFGVQALVMIAQSQYKFLPFVGSASLWYVAQFLVSIWLGLDWSNRQPFLSQPINRAIFALAAVVGAAIFGYEGTLVLANKPGHGNWSNYGMQALQFGLAMLAFSFLGKWEPRSWAGRAVVTLGGASLALYLMHPAVMEFPRLISAVERRTLGTDQIALLSVRIWPLYLALTLGITYGLYLGIKKIKLEKVLFGRA